MVLMQALDSLLAYMEPSVSIRNYTKEELLEAFCRDVDAFALELATGDNSGDLLTTVEETIEEVRIKSKHREIIIMKVIKTSTKVLAMVVSIFLTLLILLCLTACLCYCCHQVIVIVMILTVVSPGLQRQDQECVCSNQLRGGSRQQGGHWNGQRC